MSEAHLHDHDELDDCMRALANVHTFLHDEMTELDADLIRHHLHACERCLRDFDIEQTITLMLRRCCGGAKAPASLRISITQTVIRGASRRGEP